MGDHEPSMTEEHNPQAEQMADESMVRCLEAQAEAIWPQESQLIRAYGLPPEVRVLDVGCGIGAFALRFATALSESSVHGVDLIESHLKLARAKCAALGDRVRFSVGDAFELEFPEDSFDFSVCRHVLQSVPDPKRVIQEMVRVTRPGGRIHVLAEDYAMMHFHPVGKDTDRFWQDGPVRYGSEMGVDLRVGRKIYTIFSTLALRDVSVRYVVVDTVRVPRETFIRTWEAWRDGFTDAIAEHSDISREEVADYWKTMIDCLRDPHGYAVWQVPIISGLV